MAIFVLEGDVSQSRQMDRRRSSDHVSNLPFGRAGQRDRARCLERPDDHVPDVLADPEYDATAKASGSRLSERCWACRCCRGESDRRFRLGQLRSSRSPTRRSSSSRPSPIRRSSPSRTCGCSRRCSRAPPSYGRCSSRRRPRSAKVISRSAFDLQIGARYARRVGCPAVRSRDGVDLPAGGRSLSFRGQLRHRHRSSWNTLRPYSHRPVGTGQGACCSKRETVHVADGWRTQNTPARKRQKLGGTALSACRCCGKAPIGVFVLDARRGTGHSATSRSSWSRPSPTRQ